jgi:hypothetical protein
MELVAVVVVVIGLVLYLNYRTDKKRKEANATNGTTPPSDGDGGIVHAVIRTIGKK